MAAAADEPQPFVVALDIDEVLAQYLKGFVSYHNSVHGSNLKVSDFHTYKFWEVTGGTQEACAREVYDFHDTDYFRDLEVVPGAVEGVAQLVSAGVQVHAVTSRHAEIAELTQQWLAQHFPGVFVEGRIHIGNHWGSSQLQQPVSKPDMCRSIGAKVLVDDSCIYIKEVSDILQGVLFDLRGEYGWNQERIEDTSPRVMRARSWPEVVNRVQQLVFAERELLFAERDGQARNLEVVPWPGSPANREAVPWPPGTTEELKSDRECSACGTCKIA